MSQEFDYTHEYHVVQSEILSVKPEERRTHFEKIVFNNDLEDSSPELKFRQNLYQLFSHFPESLNVTNNHYSINNSNINASPIGSTGDSKITTSSTSMQASSIHNPDIAEIWALIDAVRRELEQAQDIATENADAIRTLLTTIEQSAKSDTPNATLLKSLGTALSAAATMLPAAAKLVNWISSLG